MDTIRLELAKKALAANGAVYTGIQHGGPRPVVLFRFYGRDMAMRIDQMTERTIRKHIEAKIAAFAKPVVEQSFPDSMTDQILGALERMMK